jgi:bifunctional non-homologous end joining protein LigD
MTIPRFIAPQLATLVEGPPEGPEWLHETKFDGYRAIACVGDGHAIIRTRSGLNWTDKFPGLVKPLATLRCQSAVLDGEIAVLDAAGHTNFGELQNVISQGRGRVRYYVFDLLFLNGDDLRGLPLIERKQKLAKLLSRSKRGALVYSRHVRGNGAAAFKRACRRKLEGIVSKSADDRYRSGRTRSWLKSKCGIEQEFIVVGWRPSSKAGRPFSSVLLAVRDHGRLRYCGRVGTGYTHARLGDLAEKFRRFARKSPAVRGIPETIARDAHFLKPVLVAEVALRGWTRDGLVRQSSFKGLRSDKPAHSVVREKPMQTAKAVKRTRAQRARSKRTTARRPAKKSGAKRRGAKPGPGGAPEIIEGVHVTHPDRVLFAAQGITKRQLIDYYRKVAGLMLPHIAGRPLALVRCPQGSSGQCFFQKHASPGWPEQFQEIHIREKSVAGKYLYITSKRGLVAAAQMDILELHLWGSHVDDVDLPDRMVFDLDPSPGLSFNKVKEAARDLKEYLARAGLHSFPMVTGGKGIHVLVPLQRRHRWQEQREFAEALARLMAEESPHRYVANMSKAKRRGKIFIDYLRNQRGATAIAPYSTRARGGASVALPMSWPALARAESAHAASVNDTVQIARALSAWPGYFSIRQGLPHRLPK